MVENLSGVVWPGQNCNEVRPRKFLGRQQSYGLVERGHGQLGVRSFSVTHSAFGPGVPSAGGPGSVQKKWSKFWV